MVTRTLEYLLALLALEIDTGAPLDGAKVHLFTAGPTMNDRMEISDFTEATFGGYAEITLGAWSDPYVNPTGQATVTSSPCHFEATDDTTPNTVLGFYITNAGETLLIAAQLFEDPIAFAEEFDGVTFVIDYPFGPEPD